jgi:tRNA A-37 threonylcarbamoyl transferase component Bud32
VIPAPDIPGHTITGVLGSGGFATVYRGWQIAVGREVAVKVDSRALRDERDQRRFFREVNAAGRLSGHPNVIDVYDAGTLADGRPYLVMELCPAGSLADELRRSGPMSAPQVRGIGIGIADALAAAHAAGVLHRDIKPANILVNRYGVVGLADFGLASIVAATGEQSVTREALTPAYASPESFRCEEPTAAGDLYSLAATLYALLAGRPPRFPADASSPSPAAILFLHSKPVEDVPGVPPQMVAVLRQCLAADSALRLPSAAALRDALAALPETHSYPVPAPGQPTLSDAWHAPAPPSAPTLPPPSWGGSEDTTHGAPPGAAVVGLPGRRSRRAARAASRNAQWQPAARAAALVGGGVALIVAAAALAVGLYLHKPEARSGSPGISDAPAALNAPGVFGIATVTSGCAAASVQAAAARCPANPECWQGTVDINGSVSAQSQSCSQPHSWETFAIAIMPADVSTFDQDVVAANPAVRAVCSLPVLLRSRVGRARRIPRRDWEIQVMPPDETAYYSGVRAYRCIATTVNPPFLAAPEFGP